MKITIVGGGSSAWLSAAYLLNNVCNEQVRLLRSIPHKDAVDIILLEGMNNGQVPSKI